ncbi:unnamed protein product [Didymodactylos carnosus]|uniref:Uncharacterized protein n=1 Tax=Didymodactylos carnosus TaxID=1234261 RepID=A0A814TY10_9BILA|nr:unnamed protein product [Didymodactylos carnosus]CAF1210831.1 unnamed protein product [Didymodactylos carnosus]CAF3929805.1 unnamed protein product [Didymodactylos carnosus]CAF4019762.1 unnamed protein product [Didymodactylos carnosus]
MTMHRRRKTERDLSLNGMSNKAYSSASNDESVEEDIDEKVLEDLKRKEPDIKLSESSDTSSHPKSNNVVTVIENKGGLWTRIQNFFKNYRWRMRHYFYIHVFIFILWGLLGGVIIYLIELKNKLITVHYVDAWFFCSTCVYNCGLITLDFAKLSRASQIFLMFVTFFSGITISTLPALVIKARTHKKVEGITVDDDHGDEEDSSLPVTNLNSKNLSPNVIKKLKMLPTAEQLRYRAYMLTIFLVLTTCFIIYGIAFVVIGAWITNKYEPQYLLQDGSSINGYYASFIIIITGFNQNGLSPWSDSLARFVKDIYMNLFVILVVMFGTSLFPFLLRNVVLFSKFIVPWRHKVIFDYILLNNHRLSTLLFPSVQTRIYLSITILLYIAGVSISLILDLHSENFAQYASGTRFIIFLFQTIMTRFAGFTTIDISQLASATLIVYLLLMAIKPQMLCAIDETPFELEWIALTTQDEVDEVLQPLVTDELSNKRRSSASIMFPVRQMNRFLRKKSVQTRAMAKSHFAQLKRQKRKINSRTLSRISFYSDLVNDSQPSPVRLSWIRTRLFLIFFTRKIVTYGFNFFIVTRTWLFVFIFLICCFESHHMSPIDVNITVFKVIFEVISAFGACGLTLGYPNISSSFCTVLTVPSKIILITTMLMGRHRGLLDSMKDQEKIEYNASTLLDQWRKKAMEEQEKSNDNTNDLDDVVIHPATQMIITRF